MSNPAGRLHLLARCDRWVLALPAEPIERVLSAGGELFVRTDEGPDGAGPDRAIVVEGTCYGIWDLGALLGLGPQQGAWALLRLPTPAGALPVALRLTACLDVAALPPVTPLPQGLFASRVGATEGVFVLRRPPAGVEPLGLRLHLGRLWSEDELDGTRALVAAAQDARRRMLGRPSPPAAAPALP